MSNKKNAKHSDKHHGNKDSTADGAHKLSKHEKRAKDKHKDKSKKDKHAAPLKERADHHDAEVVLKLYDLRREAVMRQSRDALFKFLPRSYDEFVAITQPSHPDNAAFRQVSSYFEMAYGFARHGIVHADLLAESTAEGLILFAKVRPYLERFRAEASPTAFRNAEWIVEHSASARQRFELFEKRVAKQLAS